jgi:ribosome-binding protein aMBF1 (putative translation factor)
MKCEYCGSEMHEWKKAIDKRKWRRCHNNRCTAYGAWIHDKQSLKALDESAKKRSAQARQWDEFQERAAELRFKRVVETYMRQSALEEWLNDEE